MVCSARSRFLLIGLAFQMGLLVYAMYVLLGVMLVSRFLAREWVEKITAERECSRPTAQIGDKAAVIVNICNTGKLPVPWLIAEDSACRARGAHAAAAADRDRRQAHQHPAAVGPRAKSRCSTRSRF